ncbi:MAG: hypothetical protein IPP72_19840 [Chitinophagaceae bacterium]|nr:hypothetical protein [Chitinophagaceae bacterium]
MDASKLTSQQLYDIIQHQQLDANIRAAANDEFTRRGLSIEEVQEIIAVHDSSFISGKQEPLNIRYKVLLILVPFFWVIHSIISGYLLAKGEKRKWKDYWQFIMIGLVLWTIGLIIVAKLHFSDLTY